ncbi:MAG: hypothetical protein KDN19_05200 [Verrucomicrobiae bacterium]|nr:hypothetical protein [Verrucomicrobiae bacterium]
MSRCRFSIFSLALAIATGPLVSFSLAQESEQAPKPAESSEAPAKTDGNSGDLPSDDAILNRLPELSTDYVQNLLGIYARLNNERMIAALSDELRRRDPNGTLPDTESDLVQDAMDLDDEPPSPFEILENKIDGLVQQQKYTEAVALMEKERTTTFKGADFPFEVDLGDTYATIGNLTAAREAYSRVTISKTAPESQRSLAESGLAELDKLEAVLAGYELIRVHKAEAALAHAEELRKKYPDDLEVQLFYAQALVPNYHYLEALPMLEDIKAKHYRGQPYPAQDALAETLRAVGRFDDARAAYAELSKDPTVPAHVREEAVVAEREVAHLRTGTVDASFEALSENEGEGYFGRLDVSAPIQPDLYGGVRAWAYEVELSKERSLRQSSGDFLGAVAFVRKYFDDNLSYVEGRIGGGSHGEVSGGVSYGHESPYLGVLGYEIAIDANLPAMDSLQMIALDGVENRVSGSIDLPLPNRFEASAGVWGRQVKADRADLGDGWGAYVEVGRPIWENVTETKQIFLGYRGEYEQFDANRISAGEAKRLGYNGDPADGALLGEDLIEPLYHPHGLNLSYEAQVNSRLFTYVGTGLFFDFADDEWDYQFTAGLEYSLGKSVDLVIEGGYYSDGTGASNDDSEVFVGMIGIRAYR